MKSFIICVMFCSTAAFASFSPAINDVLHELEDSCATVSGASYSSIESARQKHQIPDNEQMKAFAKCMLQKFKVINADGSINPDTESYTIPTDTPGYPFYNVCKSLIDRADGESARNIMNCYLNHFELVMALTPRHRYA